MTAGILTNPPAPVPEGLLDAILAAGHQAIPQQQGWRCDDLAAVEGIDINSGWPSNR